jgi:hypothetical protein
MTSSPDDWLNLIHVDDIVRVVDAVAGSADSSAMPLMNVVAAPKCHSQSLLFDTG